MRRQKIISMTDEHFTAASEMKNFSGWVREQLEKYIQDQKNDHGKLMTYKCEKCEIEFQRPPVNSRAKGLYFPTSTTCATCGGPSLRWDIVGSTWRASQ